MRLTPAITAAAIAVTAATLAAGCGSRPAPRLASPAELRGVAAVEPAVSPRPYAAADLTFGLDLLHAWCALDPTGNVVLSPASLSSGLGMAYLGARGRTATAMAGVLHLPPAPARSLAAGLHSRSLALRGLDGRGVTVAAADQVWADPSLLPLRSYLDAVATGYDAGIGRVPLLTSPARAAAQIDATVATATRGHIPRLLTANDIQNTVFVLTDALYLQARWATPFQPSSISSGPFSTAAGQHVQVHYLWGTGFSTAAADGWQAVSLPYQGGRLAMTALLPPARSTVPACQGLTSRVVTSLSRTLAAPANRNLAAIQLPEVNLTSHQALKTLLTRLGMGIAFAPDAADFSGVSPVAGYLGSVIHAATLRVDAAGTVATAATAVTIMPTAGYGGPTIVFNRPYLMLISDIRTGEPLFLTRVANPDLP
jgi:serine protease inhibitor